MDIESEEMRKLIVAIEKGKRVSAEDFDLVHRLAELGELLIKELNLPVIPEPKPESVFAFEFMRDRYNERLYWEQCKAFYNGMPIFFIQRMAVKEGYLSVHYTINNHDIVKDEVEIEIRWND